MRRLTVRPAVRTGTAAVALLLAAAAAHAAPSFSTGTPIQSAVIDTSNLGGAATRFRVDLVHESADPDLYINSVNFLPGTGYDPNIGLELGLDAADPGNHPEGYQYNGGQYYVLGTAITGDSFFHFEEPVRHFGAVDPSVAPGIYNFNLTFRGGDSASADELLADLALQVEVIQKLDVDAVGFTNPDPIHAGQTTTVSLTLTNHMADRDFVSTTWYYGNNGMEMPDGSHLENGNFVGDWFDKHVAPGQSRTDDHTTWDATAATPLGTYTGDMGVSGGLYNGDDFSIPISPTVAVVAVPEPATVSLVALSPAVLLVRRRRAGR